MRFFADRPDLLTPVRWYFVPPDRPLLDVVSPFRSRAIEVMNHEELPLLGEVAERSWDAGHPPAVYSGAKHCGTDDEWRIGCTFGTAPADCCGPDLARVLALNAESYRAVTVDTEDASACPAWVPWPYRFKVTITGGTGRYAVMNGVWTATKNADAGCTWDLDGPPPVTGCSSIRNVTLHTFGSPGAQSFGWSGGRWWGTNTPDIWVPNTMDHLPHIVTGGCPGTEDGSNVFGTIVIEPIFT